MTLSIHNTSKYHNSISIYNDVCKFINYYDKKMRYF